MKKTAARGERAAVGISVCSRLRLEANHLRHAPRWGRMVMVMMPGLRLILHGKSLEELGRPVNRQNPEKPAGYPLS